LEHPLDNVSHSNYNNSSLNFDRLHIFYFYEYNHGGRSVSTLFMPFLERAALFVVNRAPVDLMNLDSLYQSELNRL
jgi:hypothetical protein